MTSMQTVQLRDEVASAFGLSADDLAVTQLVEWGDAGLTFEQVGGELVRRGPAQPAQQQMMMAQQPQMMKPQFYTFVNHDATHPSGEAVKACALMWLQEDVVAVGYFTGEIVAWRVGGGGPAEVS